MYPHERSLVSKYKNAPFALLGINSDRNREKIQSIVREKNITWRSWFDGSTRGPISSQWNVSSWPTIYLLDQKGIIRYKRLKGKPLDQAIEKLLQEAR